MALPTHDAPGTHMPHGTPTPGITPGTPAATPAPGEPHADPIHLVKLFPDEFAKDIEAANAAAVTANKATTAAAEKILAAQQDSGDAKPEGASRAGPGPAHGG